MIKFTAHGSIDEIRALFNLLNESSACIGVKTGALHKDKGLVTGLQSFEISMRPATHFEPLIRKDSPERIGYVYVVRGKHTGRYKVGESEDVDRRILELNRQFNDRFERLAVKHCLDRFAYERYVHQKLIEWGLHIEREIYSMPDEALEWFTALPNEV